MLHPATKKPVWSAPLAGVDIRKWLPGEDWDSADFAYRRPAVELINPWRYWILAEGPSELRFQGTRHS